MLTHQKNFLEKLINSSNKEKIIDKSYPLLENAFTTQDILRGIEVILSKKITMSEITEEFEYEFSKYIGSKYALMVNSGSSANLLAAFALTNPKKKNHLKRNDKFLIPAVCWSTSLWPFVQAGLRPIFIDVNINNFCLDEKKISNNILNKIKLIVTIHVLGNSPDINFLLKLSKKKNIFLVEDTCESLGSRYNQKYLGTFGDFGTFSFYYSHQITSGEGGMIICKNKEDFELLHTLRAHGWDRGLKNKPNNSFNFINSGFNLRPLDLTAAIGLSQFKRLKQMMLVRENNRQLIINKIINHEKYRNQFDFFNSVKNLKPSWFGLPLLLHKDLKKKKDFFLKYLTSKKIENRPIISGNFLNQPSIKLFKLYNKKNKNAFPVAQDIDERGFFIGLPTKKISNLKLDYLVNSLLNFNGF